MVESWTNTVGNRLRQRDFVERDPFVTLVNAHAKLQTRNEVLEKKIIVISQSDNGGSADTALKQRNNELKEQVQQLQTDLLQKYKTEAQVSTSALNANQESQALQTQLKMVRLELSQRTELFQTSELKVTELLEKMNAQEAQLMLYRDELKRLRRTRDESDQKITELTRDNQTLLQRMLEDKQRLGDELNRMNTLYERLKNHTAHVGGGAVGGAMTAQTWGGVGGSGGSSNSNSSPRSNESKSNHASSNNATGTTGTTRNGPRSVVPKQAKMWTKAHETKVNAVVCSPDGAKFATASDDGTVKLWLTSSLSKGPVGKLLQSRSNKSPIMCIDWTSNYIVGGSTDRVATLWDVRPEREHVRLSGHKGKVLTSKFVGQSGRYVVTGSADASIRLWDTRQGFTTRTIGCSSVCNALDVAADGFTCTSGHLDGVVRTWDLRNGKSIHEMRGIHEMSITSVQFSPSTCSAHLMLTVSRENKMRTFDSMTWEPIMTLENESFTVGATTTQGVFSSDALYAAAGSANGNVYVWDVTTGQLIQTLEKHQSVVTGMAWRQDGRLLFSTDQRGYCVVWA
jgi:autophagy-related protein 16